MSLVLLAGAACVPMAGPKEPEPPDTNVRVDSAAGADTGGSSDTACDTASWYLDADGDGVGADTARVDACDAPAGYVPEGSDCDDTEPDVRAPTSVDYCENGKDENCDGVDSDCRELGEGDIVARFTQVGCGNSPDPSGGEALVAIDGALLAGHGSGCAAADGETWNMGVVYVWRGPVEGEHRLDEALQVILPPEQFRAEEHKSFGSSVAAVGEVGMVVGTYEPYVFYYDDYLATDPVWTWTEPHPAMDVGGVIGSGDLDGDGLPEVAFDGSWYMGGYSQPIGVAHVIAGTAVGETGEGDQVADITEGRGVWLGYDLDVIGDADGDGLDDLVVAGSGIFVFRGPVAGVLGRSESDAWVDDDDLDPTFLTGVGDQTGDGLADFLVSYRYSAVASAAVDGEIIPEAYAATLRCDRDGDVGSTMKPNLLGDANDDGTTDVFIERSEYGWVVFGPLRGTLDCSTDGQRSGVGDVLGQAAIADLHGDSAPELAILAADLDAVVVLSPLGAGL